MLKVSIDVAEQIDKEITANKEFQRYFLRGKAVQLEECKKDKAEEDKKNCRKARISLIFFFVLFGLLIILASNHYANKFLSVAAFVAAYFTCTFLSKIEDIGTEKSGGLALILFSAVSLANDSKALNEVSEFILGKFSQP